MKIKKSSIGFKLRKFFAEKNLFRGGRCYSPEKTLCRYFWSLLINFLGLLVSWSIVSIVILVPLSVLIAPIMFLISDNHLMDESHTILSIITLGSLLVYIVLNILYSFIRKSDSILFRYMRALKERVCPIIEFEE